MIDLLDIVAANILFGILLSDVVMLMMLAQGDYPT
jgi:hypothetical protein